LPTLLGMARDEKLDQNYRYAALWGIERMAERKDAEELFLELIKPGHHNGVRGQAMLALARLDCRKAVPAILDALTDKEWYVRATADHALRAFAERPAGVGYDTQRPDASGWRRWWKAASR
jgi:HEAT repeat protein